MNYSLAVLLVSDEVKLIGCQFTHQYRRDERIYTFKCAFEVEVGDFVIVDTVNGYGVCRVVDADVAPNMNDTINYKWAFDKVDETRLKSLKEQEDVAIKHIRTAELQKQRKELARELGVDESVAGTLSFKSDKE
jgi:hypothetical protein